VSVASCCRLTGSRRGRLALVDSERNNQCPPE
jgi:hypothetical protein